MSLSITFTPPPGSTANGAIIAYDETPDSPQEMMQANSFRSKRTFIVPWINRWQFAAVMLGYPVINRSQNFAVDGLYALNRLTPQYYSPIDLDPLATPWLFATSLDGIQGEGKIISYDIQGVAQYSKARISIGFEALTYRVLSDDDMINAGNVLPHTVGSPDESYMARYITKFRQPTAEYLQLPFGALKWVQPKPLTNVPGGTVGTIQAAQEVSYTWHQVPNVPSSVKTQIGTVNSSAFDNKQYLRGQLLLTNVEVRPYRWFFNQRLFDITYKFRFFAPSGGGPTLDIVSQQRQEDANGLTLLEPYGNNHFLHYRDIGKNNVDNNTVLLPPQYDMLSNDGLGPPAAFVDFSTSPGYNSGTTSSSAAPISGRTVYTYSDFENLFRPGPNATPPE